VLRNVNVHTDRKIKLLKSDIHTLIKSLREELNFSITSLDINFVDSSYIHQLNKEYLAHDYSTDIITFNYSGENDNLDGEIFISHEDAKRNSEKYVVTFSNELIRLVIHGVLHLLGYNDKTAKEKRIMKKMENMLVIKFSKSFNNLVHNYDR